MKRFGAVLIIAVVITGVAMPALSYAEEERIPSDTLWRFQERYLHYFHGLATAWSTFTGSPDVRVAVLDGFFAWHNADFDPNRFYRTTDQGYALHGTQVASIIGAKSDNILLMTGVDWNCSLGIYSVSPSSISSMVGALDAALSGGARVVNCSWRSQTGEFPWEVQRKVAEAYQAGVVVVAAAGNKLTPEHSPFPVTPGSLNGLAIGVGGLDQYGALHPLSNYSWGTDFVACADTIGVALDDNTTYTTAFSGTSMATPIVTGCASLIMGFATTQGYPDLDFDDTYQLLRLCASWGGIREESRSFEKVGFGLPRPSASFAYLSFPNRLERFDVTGPWTESVQQLRVKVNLPGLNYDWYDVVRHELIATAAYPRPFDTVQHAWGNGRLSAGAMWADESGGTSGYLGGTVTPNQWGEVVDYGPDSVHVRTYWYEISGYGSWPPTETIGAKVAVTVTGELTLTPSPSFARYDTANATATTWFPQPSTLPVQWNDVFMKVGNGNWSRIARMYPSDTAVLVQNINRGSETYSFAVTHINPHQNSGFGPAASIHTRPNPPTSADAEVVMLLPLQVGGGEFGEVMAMSPAGPDPGDPIATTEVDVSWSPPANQADAPAHYDIAAWRVGEWHYVYPCWATGCCPCKTVEVFSEIEALSERIDLDLPNHEYEISVYAVGSDGQVSEASNSAFVTTGSDGGIFPWDSLPVGWKPFGREEYRLGQNNPNPFNASTSIEFSLRDEALAVLDIFNVLGQHVARVVEGVLPPGPHSVEWDGKDERGNALASGIYLYRLQVGNQVMSKKMILLR